MTEENKLEQPSPNDVGAALINSILAAIDRKSRSDIRAVYANFATFEVSDLDLKILFGQINQQASKEADLHTAVTMAWAEAKLLSFFLQVNLAIYEMQNGPIAIPPAMLPGSIPAPDEKASARAHKTFDTLRALHSELIEEQKHLRKNSPEEPA